MTLKDFNDALEAVGLEIKTPVGRDRIITKLSNLYKYMAEDSLKFLDYTLHNHYLNKCRTLNYYLNERRPK